MRNPCLACGACCATFRVSFYRGEAVPGEGAVPEALTTPVTPFRLAMLGTTAQPVRCVALDGTVGQRCACTIHPLRPSPCREFDASWEQGRPHDRCDQARARHALPALTAADWR